MEGEAREVVGVVQEGEGIEAEGLGYGPYGSGNCLDLCVSV